MLAKSHLQLCCEGWMLRLSKAAASHLQHMIVVQLCFKFGYLTRSCCFFFCRRCFCCSTNPWGSDSVVSEQKNHNKKVFSSSKCHWRHVAPLHTGLDEGNWPFNRHDSHFDWELCPEASTLPSSKASRRLCVTSSSSLVRCRANAPVLQPRCPSPHGILDLVYLSCFVLPAPPHPLLSDRHVPPQPVMPMREWLVKQRLCSPVCHPASFSRSLVSRLDVVWLYRNCVCLSSL